MTRFHAGRRQRFWRPARAYLNHAPGAIRGRHPTNSCTSLGTRAEEIAAADGPEFPKYNPYAKVVEFGGKNLMLGTVDERNCPFTFHHVQELLGHTRGHPFSGLLETTYIDRSGVKRNTSCANGRLHRGFTNHGGATCRGGGRIWPGRRSLSAIVDARKSAEVLQDLTQTPHLVRCDDRSCISCYGRFQYNGLGALAYYPRRLPMLLGKAMRRALG